MNYVQFVLSAGKWALGKQKYLNKVWQEATKGGKIILESHFPKLLNKAKDYYNEFKGFTPKVVPKEVLKKKVGPYKTILEVEKVGPKKYEDVLKDVVKAFGKDKKSTNIIPFPKKPPGKADGGRIDKPLPTRSRDI